jgi:hypothetical protein
MKCRVKSALIWTSISRENKDIPGLREIRLLEGDTGPEHGDA